MRAIEIMNARGEVTPSFVNIATGERVPWPSRHNTLSYDAAKAVAMALGGDASLIPDRIGIIFGDEETTSFKTIDRNQTWSELQEELRELSADVQIRPFSYSPSLVSVSKSDTESGWGVVFHSHSDSSTEGAVSSGNIFTSGKYIFQAVLLHKNSEDYTVLARVSLISGSKYLQKPENFEVALDWTVKFF